MRYSKQHWVDGATVLSAHHLEHIESGISEIHNAASNALKGTASGTIVRLDDVSPLEHSVPVRVSSKNLIPYPYRETILTRAGINYTVSESGTVTANGTATGTSSYQCIVPGSPLPIKAGTYTLSGCPTGGGDKTFSITFGFRKNVGDARTTYVDIGDGKAFTLTEDGHYDVVIAIRVDFVADNLVFKPQLELGTTATAYTPYVDDLTGVTVKALRKNLVDPAAYIRDNSQQSTVDGDVFTTNFPNAGVHVNTGWSNRQVNHSAGTYTVTFIPVSEGACANIIVYPTAEARSPNRKAIASLVGAGSNNNPSSLTFTANEKFFVSLGGVGAGNYGTHSYKLQLEAGSNATEYEPYIEPASYPVSEDGICEVTSISPTMTLTTDTEGVVMDCEYNRDIQHIQCEGVYELVEEITTTADLTSINRTTWPEGTPYNFKAAKVKLFIPIGKGNGMLVTNYYDGDNNLVATSLVSNGIRNTQAQYQMSRAWKEHGVWESEFTEASASVYSATLHKAPGYDGGERDTNIARIMVTGNTSGIPLPAGTNIKIYGVRA